MRVRLSIALIVTGAVVLLHREGGGIQKALYLLLVAGVVVLALPTVIRGTRPPDRRPDRRLLLASATLAAATLLSLVIALLRGTHALDIVRDASIYGLLAAAPVLAIALREEAGPRFSRWLLCAAGVATTISFTVYWIDVRGAALVGVHQLLLPSFYLPAALFAYATAVAIRTREQRPRWLWAVLAVSIAAALTLTGTRSVVVFFAAPLVQLVSARRWRVIAVCGCAVLVLAVAAVLITSGSPRNEHTGVAAVGRQVSLISALTHPWRDESLLERRREAASALRAWRSAPLLGVGSGYIFHWANYRGADTSSYLLDSPFGTLAKFGVIGMIGVIVFLVASVGLVRARRRSEGFQGAGAEGLLGFGAIALVGLLVNTPWEDKGFSVGFLLLLSLAMPGAPDAPLDRKQTRRLASVLALTTTALLIASAVWDRASPSGDDNATTEPLLTIAAFERALWEGDGLRACSLLTSVEVERQGGAVRCRAKLSRIAVGDPAFVDSSAEGPIRGGGTSIRRYVIKRRDGAREARYLVSRQPDGSWSIARFGWVTLPRAMR